MTEWTRDRPTSDPGYIPSDPQCGRALVGWDLCELGLGEELFVRVENRLRYGRSERLADIGVCRAYVLTEAAWPQGAELCVTVDWSPDASLRHDGDTGKVPAGAEEHRRERITATAHPLESLGSVVEPSRFVCSPHHYSSAELLVYQMPDGVPPTQAAADTDWVLPKPVPPHRQQHCWPYPEQSPEELVRNALYEAGFRTYQQDRRSPFGRIGVRRIT
ncbi:hypothetical protein ACWF9B_01155 [Streptomyces sp. NPDC055089]